MATKKLSIALGRYEMRNGGKVRITKIDMSIRASDGRVAPHAFGHEEVSGEARMWSGDSGRRLPINAPSANKPLYWRKRLWWMRQHIGISKTS